MDNQTLKTIQVFSKIGKILSEIIFICSIVGAAGCALGIASLAVGETEVFQLGGVTIHGIIETSAETSIGTRYTLMTVGLILCIGEIFLAKIAENYFKHELATGTPFTFDGAKEMLRLGICAVCIPMGTMIVAEIAYTVMNHYYVDVADLHIDDYASVGLGIAFIVVSFICKYGAELQSNKKME
ncbi:MAG: hypothetical protein PUD93_01075 [Lachnospiraceae bacterium]|nr:hypothetical protein [Lachnospiraceae bacterium]